MEISGVACARRPILRHCTWKLVGGAFNVHLKDGFYIKVENVKNMKNAVDIDCLSVRASFIPIVRLSRPHLFVAYYTHFWLPCPARRHITLAGNLSVLTNNPHSSDLQVTHLIPINSFFFAYARPSITK